MDIRPIPWTYRGERFRSKLEADWAATLDSLDIKWVYEPEAYELADGGRYLPDFWLPAIGTWLEVKGPHRNRIDKAYEFAEIVAHSPKCRARDQRFVPRWHELPCRCFDEFEVVVLGLPPIAGQAQWQVLNAGCTLPGDGRLWCCRTCGQWWWCGLNSYGCRAHRRFEYGDDDLGETYGSSGEFGSWYEGGLPFVRATAR